MEHTSNEKISDALKLLEEAAKEKKEELRSALTNKYAHLKNIIVETEVNFARSLSDARRHVVEAAVHAKDVSVEKTQEIAHDVNRNVHHHPWPYIGGAAVVGLMFGYILGRNRN
jgi:ElaB/YqjD/DUF883 family membrane-anchored ribosome-binding protein